MPRKAKNSTKDKDIKVVFDKNAVKVKKEEDDDMPSAEDIEKWNVLGIKILDKEEVANLKNAKFKQYCLHLQRWNSCLETQLQFEEYKLKLLMDYHNGLIEQNTAIDKHRKDCDDCRSRIEGKFGKELCRLDIDIETALKTIETMKSSYDEKRAAHKIKSAELEEKMEAIKKKGRNRSQSKKKTNTKKKVSSDCDTDDEVRNNSGKKKSNNKDWVKSESESEMECNDSKTKSKVKYESDEEMDTDLESKKKVKSESDSDSEYDKSVKKEVKSESDSDIEDEKDFKKEIKEDFDEESDDEKPIVKQQKKELKEEEEEEKPVRRSRRSIK